MRSDLLYRAIPWTRMMRQKRVFRNDLNTRSSQVASVAVALLLSATVIVTMAAIVVTPAVLGPGAWRLLLLVTSTLIVTYAALNWHFLAYVRRLRGTAFALRTLVMHWWFHVYSAAGLAIGLARPSTARVELED